MKWAEPVDRLLLDSATNGSERVLVLPTASAPEGDDVFDRWGRLGIDHYRKIGAAPEVVPVKTREDAERRDLAARVEDAGLIFFSGGNPGYAVKVLKGTRFWSSVLQAVRDGTSLGGCSAGAGMLGAIAPDVTSESVAGMSKQMWLEGLLVYPKLLIGAHWDALDGYMPGLKDFIVESIPPGATMLAIDEDTAVVGREGRWTVHGRGGASVILPGGSTQVFSSGSKFDLAESQEEI